MSNASLASGRSGHRGPTELLEVDVVMEEPPTELHPLLSERHVNMITFSCCIGVGLFLQCGHVIYLAGPGMAIIAYLLTGSIIWSAMACLGEMTALFPISGPLFQFPCRYLDQGIGYAVGWMAWFAWIVILAAELLAVTQLFKFEFQDTYLEMVGIDQDVSYAPGILAVNPAVWVLLFWIVILVINFMPIRWYGELEYLFGSFKMVFIIGLIMFNVVISAMGQGYREVNPSNPFWTYTNPYGFWSNNITINSTAISNGSETSKALTIDGSKGRFLAVWTAMTAVAFSMIGFETVAITAAENKDLRNQETVKIATRKITLRILVLYTLSAFTAGLNVPYTDENLANFAANSIRSGEYSIFVLAAVRSRLPGWAKFFNGVLIFSATTSAINSLYLSSRLLHALASDYNAWPRFAQRLRARLSITKYGVPMAAVFTSWLFGSLAFLSSGREPTQVLSNLATNSVVSMLIVYTVICASYLRFNKVREERANGVGLEDLSEIDRHREMRKFNRRSPRYPYKSHWQWLRAVYALVGCLLMVLFLGWASFLEPFHPGQFVAAYISIPVFLILTIAYHVKLDEANPLNWSLKHNDDMSDPMTVANPDDRRGRLKFNLKGNPVTLNNAKNVADFVWAWMK